MPKKKSENRIKAQELYELYKGNITNREIASRLGISEKSVSGWKSLDNWTGNNLSTKKKSDLSTKKKRGGQPGNKNAKGNLRNQNARKHGLYSKYLPEELNEIIQDFDQSDPLDILWYSIQVQWANILHAQEILFVENKEDKTKEITMQGDNTTAYEVQHAWDKQSNSLKAQSRAMSDLNKMINSYYGALDRRKDTASDEQRERIALLEAQKAKLEADHDNALGDGTQDKMDAIDGILAQMQPLGDEDI